MILFDDTENPLLLFEMDKVLLILFETEILCENNKALANIFGKLSLTSEAASFELDETVNSFP